MNPLAADVDVVVVGAGLPGLTAAAYVVRPQGHLADASFASGREAGLAALHYLEHRALVR